MLTINAVNFIDGLDGLAAGVTAIGAGAFFVYAYHLAILHYTDVAAAPTLLSAALAGACVGFLPHNFAPARVFMGDSGSMLVGLLLSAAAVTATTTVDPQIFQSRSTLVPLALPLLIPLAVLAVPLIDLLLAVVRRVGRGQSPFAPDKQHLHHRMLALGHTPSPRRAAAVLLVRADRRRRGDVRDHPPAVDGPGRAGRARPRRSAVSVVPRAAPVPPAPGRIASASQHGHALRPGATTCN